MMCIGFDWVCWCRLGLISGGDVGTGSVRFGGSGRVSGDDGDDGLTVMVVVGLIFISVLLGKVMGRED
ncbi:unnamed protein product [Prunus armeniaca]|uniref:Uncharacterized protein n=1 Tax=Prunus armeniaca TaxID=36596 RepID=A0A6J5U966_PRUAR|nr:unnamed protein product [Prunus armeniaca]